MTPDQTRLRPDLALVAQGLAAARSRAREPIKRWHVCGDGQTAEPPALVVEADARVSVTNTEAGFVSHTAGKVYAVRPSPITGGSGNVAFLLGDLLGDLLGAVRND